MQEKKQPEEGHVHFLPPIELLREFDELVGNTKKFKNRTDALLFLMRYFIRHGGVLP